MKSNLPQVYKDGIFNKLKRFWTGLFYKKQEGLIVKDLKVHNNIKRDNSFKINLLEPEINRIAKEKEIKGNIIDMVEKNPELLQSMSIENLKKLVKVYEDAIKEKEEKIEKLKKTA